MCRGELIGSFTIITFESHIFHASGIAAQQKEITMNSMDMLIREARADDFEWVKSLMQNALEPYYGGDHRAHAKRIFDAHIAGGFDHIGFFSFEQKMFVAEVNKERAAMIHMVGKRQATYKISPLIVDLKFQGKAGLGSKLLEYAEDYARNHEARQLRSYHGPV